MSLGDPQAHRIVDEISRKRGKSGRTIKYWYLNCGYRSCGTLSVVAGDETLEAQHILSACPIRIRSPAKPLTIILGIFAVIVYLCEHYIASVLQTF